MDRQLRGEDSHDEVTIPEAMQLALGWHREGRVRTAAEVYRRILAHNPDHADALHFLGIALHQLGQSANGAALLRRALELVPDYAEASNNLGNILKETGDLAGAEEAYRRALEFCPDNTDTLNNLGVVLKERGLLDDAVTTFEQALALDPRHADLWHNLGNTLKKLGRTDEALTAYRQAIILKPYHTEAYRNLGRMLYIAGRSTEAAEVYRQWLVRDPDNPVARHLLAACSREEIPERASDAYVAATFDTFATSFDDVMARLNYRAPALALDAVRHVCGEPAGTLSVLDAGCGTGMCGPLLRPYAARLTGVDLSCGMLDRAGGRGVYDDLVQTELTAYLARQARRFDLIISVDTLCYFGELGAVVAAAAGALRQGGWFVFTLEAGEDNGVEGYALQPHGRYNHAAGYVRRVLGEAGLHVMSLGRDFLRSEGGQTVEGLVAVARCDAR
ncbi:MAG: tetratricopeptide repeat protein [Desulfuromonadales bacterium]|nr:MAG: tetratricopeptide repeat protein [Desulfuromonadales bacterium]